MLRRVILPAFLCVNWPASGAQGRSAFSQCGAGVPPELQQLNLAWTFDRTGNRLTESKGAGALPPLPARSFGIQPSSNRLASITPNGASPLPRQYDAVGNTLLDDEGRASVYNGRNRLAQITRAGLSAAYQHNAFGERVSKTVAGASSQYVYDPDGHVVGEYAADGSLITETVWLGDVPVAVLKPAGFVASHGGRAAGSVAVFFVQPDHLDSPRVIVNASNTPVLRWDSAPFGDTIANEQPGGGSTPTFSYHLRFPGQQYDSESELHYNYFRDYEPGVGRYVQSDPIGLAGGINTFVYVGSTPASNVDSDGLRRTPKPSGSRRERDGYPPQSATSNLGHPANRGTDPFRD